MQKRGYWSFCIFLSVRIGRCTLARGAIQFMMTDIETANNSKQQSYDGHKSGVQSMRYILISNVQNTILGCARVMSDKLRIKTHGHKRAWRNFRSREILSIYDNYMFDEIYDLNMQVASYFVKILFIDLKKHKSRAYINLPCIICI